MLPAAKIFNIDADEDNKVWNVHLNEVRAKLLQTDKLWADLLPTEPEALSLAQREEGLSFLAQLAKGQPPNIQEQVIEKVVVRFPEKVLDKQLADHLHRHIEFEPRELLAQWEKRQALPDTLLPTEPGALYLPQWAKGLSILAEWAKGLSTNKQERLVQKVMVHLDWAVDEEKLEDKRFADLLSTGPRALLAQWERGLLRLAELTKRVPTNKQGLLAKKVMNKRQEKISFDRAIRETLRQNWRELRPTTLAAKVRIFLDHLGGRRRILDLVSVGATGEHLMYFRLFVDNLMQSQAGNR